MGGVPCIRGTRIPVAPIIKLLAAGTSAERIVEEFPQLTMDDVRDVSLHAAAVAAESELPLRPST